MTTILNDIETRVLGYRRLRKQVTTPEYYPLTLNALTLASIRKTIDSPVTSLQRGTVSQALETLREKNLAYVFYGSTSRVPKYKHVMPEVMHLSAPGRVGPKHQNALKCMTSGSTCLYFGTRLVLP